MVFFLFPTIIILKWKAVKYLVFLRGVFQNTPAYKFLKNLVSMLMETKTYAQFPALMVQQGTEVRESESELKRVTLVRCSQLRNTWERSCNLG